MRLTERLSKTFRLLSTDWLYCLLQGLLALVDIAFWLVVAVVSPLLVLALGPRLAAVLKSCASWLADLHGQPVSWRQDRRPTSTVHGARLDPPGHSSTWRALRCLGTNILSLPVHAAAVFVFPAAMAWAPAHSRLLGWALSEPPATSEPDRRGGHGLVGMRERVRALGGTLETGPDDQGGFRVLAVLPLDLAPETAGPADTGTGPVGRPAFPEGPDQEDT